MSLTLAQLWGEVARNMGGVYLDGTATSGSTTTIVDTTNLPAIGGDDYLNNAYACIITDAGGAHAAPEGQTRVTSDFARSTGTLTVASVFTVAPAVGDTYRVWTGVPRTDLVDGVEAALRAVYPAFYAPVVDETLVVVTNQYEYTVPATIGQLTEVYEQADTAATHYNLLPDWRFKTNGATRQFVLEPRHTYTVGRTLRCVGIGPIACPTTDYGTVTMPSEFESALLEFVGAYGAMLCHQRLMSRDRDNKEYHFQMYKDLGVLAARAKGKHMPTPPMRAVVSYPWYW